MNLHIPLENVSFNAFFIPFFLWTYDAWSPFDLKKASSLGSRPKKKEKIKLKEWTKSIFFSIAKSFIETF